MMPQEMARAMPLYFMKSVGEALEEGMWEPTERVLVPGWRSSTQS